jgi:hypothetical protein
VGDFWSWAWAFFWFFAYVAFLFALVFILIDLFRDHSVGGWGKAGWLILIVFFPFLGGLIYLIARGSGMAARESARRERPREDDDYTPRPLANPTEEIARAQELLDRGVITSGEFDAIKNKALGGRF